MISKSVRWWALSLSRLFRCTSVRAVGIASRTISGVDSTSFLARRPAGGASEDRDGDPGVARRGVGDRFELRPVDRARFEPPPGARSEDSGEFRDAVAVEANVFAAA